MIFAVFALVIVYWYSGWVWRATSTPTPDVVPSKGIVIEVDTRPHPYLPPLEPVKYLAYYPHGGFHTQRIALENALTLCRLLDRTLLLPPLWIGQHPKWSSTPSLRNGIDKSSKASLGHCRDSTAYECEWTQVSWDWVVDLPMADVAWVDRWDLSDKWLSTSTQHGGLGISDEAIYRVTEDRQYGVQISDTAPNPRAPYRKTLPVASLLDVDQPLIHFDSLAGSTRLLLERDEAVGARHEVQSSMVLANPLILGTADRITKLLGPGFVAVDARLHGKFDREAGRNMRAAWWELGRRLRVSEDVLKRAEEEVWARSPGWRKSVSGSVSASYPDPPARLIDSALEKARANRPPPDSKSLVAQAKGSTELVCPRIKHSVTSKLAFNTPLFLTTSADDPQSHPALRLFYSTYPCIFTLRTPEIMAVLDEDIPQGTVNKLDGYDLAPWLHEWVGWEVAARAQELVTTNGSAWGKWAEEMVQPIAKE